VEAAAKYLAARPLPMIGEIKAARLYEGVEVETRLDPHVQPFLFDHQMNGEPLLPGVMGTEAFAELATLLAPGYHVAAVQNERFGAPFKFYRCEPRTLHLTAIVEPLAGGELLAHAVLRSVTQPAKPGLPVQVKEHFAADVRLTRDPVPPADAADLPSPWPPPADAMPIDRAPIYKIYFHGPSYQVLERAQVAGAEVTGLMADALPPAVAPAEARTLMAPRLIELCFQAAGIWQIATQSTMALPASLAGVTCYRQPEEAAGRRLYAHVTALEDGQRFEARVLDELGQVYVALQGYQTVKLPGEVRLA
jgi:hypothetical protein